MHLRGDALDAAGHLAGGAAREGHQQDAARIGAVDDQMGDAVGQRVGLARAGAGDDQQRAAGAVPVTDAVLDGAALLGIEAMEVVDLGEHGQIRGYKGGRVTLFSFCSQGERRFRTNRSSSGYWFAVAKAGPRMESAKRLRNVKRSETLRALPRWDLWCVGRLRVGLVTHPVPIANPSRCDHQLHLVADTSSVSRVRSRQRGEHTTGGKYRVLHTDKSELKDWLG